MKYCAFIFIVCDILFTIVCGEEKCFEDLECFPLGEPWSSFKRPIPPPDGPDVVKVEYHLYTRNHPVDPIYIKGESNWNLQNSDYDRRKKTVMFVHGWLGSGNDSWIVHVTEGMLKNVDVNLFIVDYGSIKEHKYLQSVSNARVVGALMAKFIKHLLQYEGASLNRLHLIGVSLGAHVASYAAKRVPGIDRLTGLDPAQPLFEGESSEVRFDKDDAQHVDVAHTNGRPTIPFAGLGFNSPIGHVDFFFNGGWNQPGCSAEVAGSAFRSLMEGNLNLFEVWPQRLLCPHSRVVNYYVEAISNPNCTFWGTKRQDAKALLTILSRGWLSRVLSSLSNCNTDSCSPFGMRTFDFPARGSFDIATSNNEPYCVNSEKVDALMEKKLQEYRSSHQNS